MSRITEKGKAFELELHRQGVGPRTGHERETLSLLCRHATTYGRIQIRWANEEMSERETARLEAREERLEAIMAKLAAELPGVERIEFGGDPRGHTVKLHYADPHIHNSWGGAGGGMGVLGS
jgi:hypothetical protein